MKHISGPFLSSDTSVSRCFPGPADFSFAEMEPGGRSGKRKKGCMDTTTAISCTAGNNAKEPHILGKYSAILN